MKLTSNYGLKKPEGTDVVNIDDLNDNADIIDIQLAGKVDKVSGKGLSTNDYTTTEKNKLAGIQAGAQVNAVTSVAGKTGAVTLSASDVSAVPTSRKVNNKALTGDISLTPADIGAATSAQGNKADTAIQSSQLGQSGGPAKQDDFTSHLSDNLYQKAGGTATAITLTGVVLEDGHPKTFIASANNNRAATTVNGKPLYKPNTTAAPNLIAGKAYAVWYNQPQNCFFIKASAEGNTVAAHVLAGDTFSNDTDTGLTGTMTNNGAVTITPSGSSQSIPEGYHNGSGIVTAISLQVGDVLWHSNDTYTQTTATSMKKVKETSITNMGGRIRVKFDLATNLVGNTAYGQIYKNGIAVGTLRSTTSSSFTTYSEDITIAVGDLLQIYAHTSNGGQPVNVKNFRLYSTFAPAGATDNL